MGVVGSRQVVTEQWRQRGAGGASTAAGSQVNQATQVAQAVMDIVERECSREGGVQAAAQIWIERARGLQKGQGKAITAADDAQVHE